MSRIRLINTKKYISIMLSLVLLVMSASTTIVVGATEYTEGTLKYTIDATGSITITGYFGYDGTVEVPSSIAGKPVNTIAKGAFIGTAATKVYLPDTIMTIEVNAFPDTCQVVMSGEPETPGEPDTPDEPDKPCTHSWNSGTIIKQPTCTADGQRTYTCTKCGETKTAKINKLGHSASSEWMYDTNRHWHICLRCGEKVNTSFHTWDKGVVTDEINNTKLYTCTVCKKTETIVGKINIDAATVTVSNQKYSGKEKTPQPEVNCYGKDLVKGTDYTVTYSNNIKVGTAKISIKGIGDYQGTIEKTFKINPKGTSISKLTAASKAFTVKWKAQKTQTTGYQIRYSTKSGMKNATIVRIKKNKTTSKKIKKLKSKKKYYVQIRTYKLIDGKYYYSSWSSKKTIKTKK